MGWLVIAVVAAGCSAAQIVGSPPTVGPSVTAPPTPVPTAALASPEQSTPSTSATDPVASSRPWTAAELQLLAGVREDVLATGCRAVEEDDLPTGATAGVGCDIRSELVDGVGFYQFDSLDALMAVYEARLAEYDIPLATDVADIGQPPRDCWRGYESESLYWPGGDAELGMNREGCFVNELGFANLRYVWGGPLVYVGVLGNGGDIAALKAWSWYDEDGDEPVPGGPGIWQPNP